MIYTNRWTNRLSDLIKEAAQEIIPIVGTVQGQKTYSRGAGGDITLEIDRKAENFILNCLKKYKESFNVISEEIGNRYWDADQELFFKKDSVQYKSTSNFFLIDPVDGSTNAKRGIPFYCISIAYATSANFTDLQIGVVYDIATNDLYVAEKGHGSYLNEKPIHCSEATTISTAILGTDLDPRRILPDYQLFKQNLLTQVRKVRVFGACALELCLVARGGLDIYFDMRGITRIVDIAAGILILTEAGGIVWNEDFTSIKNHEVSLNLHYSLIAFTPTLSKELKEKRRDILNI
ncbi:Fructose-1,6-bisphosphatase/inositol-1-monophosphatase [Candidatus Lokiarchaeum ossiferum]|uniref:Fructose-1, 6-bisphosphatase/inositol-1-monophosphatase n=1 Tax=Candidatus Lokiarchaeum ossiferum TaxID=2951803 RepID=A0ABY6I0T6_9ARCH|nr:Fructose-1,6-bisphosphatase/inositol-1-monophosphatase [Candidatus Lokiarchaeum sp. B-35]